MNNRIYVSIISAVLLVAITFSACQKNKQDQEEPQNVSYCQTSLWIGRTTDYRITLTKGKSENLFVADGKTGELEDFVLLTVTPTSTDLINGESKYKLVGEDGEIEDVLNKDAFGAYLTAKPNIDSLGKLQKIVVINGKQQSEIELEHFSEGRIDGKQAIDSAKEGLKEKLQADDKDREIYVRLINNASDPDSKYYWYVAFIANPTDYYSALVDVDTGEIVNNGSI